MQGDPYRLKQILINLVSNAVKFTMNGKIHFSIKTSETKSGEMELIMEVIDTGIGIEEDKINIIFEDFTQAEMSTTRKFGGTGLGLSIVRKLVELHNGRIDIRSKKDQGTHITCYLPYLVGDEKRVESDAVPLLHIPEEVRNLKALVVDDEEYNRLLFKTILKRWNMHYSEAENGMEAIELLKNNKFDLVFMDARMPGTDGFSATQLIRQELKITPLEMPVICISATAAEDDWDKYERAGMNAFLEKPFTEEMLMTTIITVLRDKSAAPASDDTAQGKNRLDSDGQINLESLFHISGGDLQFAEQMIITFLETTANGLSEMNKAALEMRWNDVSDVAHRLLPPCRHLGASALCILLREIEENIKGQADAKIIETLIKESSHEFGIIREKLNEKIANIK